MAMDFGTNESSSRTFLGKVEDVVKTGVDLVKSLGEAGESLGLIRKGRTAETITTVGRQAGQLETELTMRKLKTWAPLIIIGLVVFFVVVRR